MPKGSIPFLQMYPLEGKIRAGNLSDDTLPVTSEEAQQLQAHIQGIAQILYKNTPETDLVSFEAIEKSVRQQMLEHVSPQVAFFLSSKSLGRPSADRDN